MKKVVNCLILIISLIMIGVDAYAASGMTYHGRILRSDSTPVEGQFVGFRFKIMDGNTGVCEMYQETHTKDLRNSGGVFAIVIGDGSVSGTYNVSGVTYFDEIFKNDRTFNFSSPAGCVATPYAAASRDGRKLNVQFRESPSDPWEDLPVVTLSYVPFAYSSLYAKQVGDHTPASLLRVENAGIPQSIAALTPQNYTDLMSLLGGNFVGSVLGTSGQISVSTTSGTATVSLSDVSGVTPATYGSSSQVPVITVDQKGRVTSISTVAVVGGGGGSSGISALTGDVTASGSGSVAATISNDAVTSGKILDGTIATADLADGSATLAKLASDSVNSAKIVDGSITGSDVASTAALSIASVAATGNVGAVSMSTNAIALYELPGNGTNYLQFQAADNMAANYVLKWPATDGTSGQVLSTDGAGNLTWIAASSGSLTGLTGDVVASGSGSVSATIQNGVVTLAKLASDSVDSAKIVDGSIATADLADDSVSFAKLQNIATNRLLGRSTASSGDIEELSVGTGLSLASGVLSATGGTGDFKADGTVPMTGQFLSTGGSAAAPGISFVGDTNTGMYSDATDSVGLSAGGTSGLYVNSSGNVGIGTTSPSYKLDVDTQTSNVRIANSGSNSAGSLILEGYADSPSWMSGTLILRRARGTQSSASYAATGDNLGYIGFRNHATSNGAAIGAVATENHSSTARGTALQFSVAANSPSNSVPVALYLAPTANVGIGTTNPTGKLTITAGTTTVAPIVLSAGSLLSTPISGAIEYDGTSLYYTDSTSTRRTLGVSGGGITALTGDVTASGSGSVAATISAGSVSLAKLASDSVDSAKIVDGSVATADLADDSVSFAKLQNIATNRLLGRSTASSGDIEELSVGTGLSLASGVLSATGSDTFAGLPCGDGYIPYKSSGAWTCKEVSSANTNDAIITRDSSGNFVAGTGQFSTSVKITDGAAGGQITLSAPTAFTSYSLKLPTGDGTSNQVLRTDGSGNLGWMTAGTGNGDFKADGTVPMTGQFLSTGGSAAAPGIAFVGDTNTGMYSDAADSVGISTGGTSRLYVNSSGNVGIGNNSPSGRLHIEQSSNTNTGGLILDESGSTETTKFFMDGSDYINIERGTSAIKMNGDFQLNLSGSERLRVDASGNVGVGTTTPAAALQVVRGTGLSLLVGGDGTGSTLTDSTTKVSRIGIPHYLNAEEPAAILHANSNATDSYITFGGGTGAMNAMTNLRFFTAANNTTTSGTERMRIDASGNVGIGTTSPSTALHVIGEGKFSGSSAGNVTGVTVANTNTGNTVTSRLNFENGSVDRAAINGGADGSSTTGYFSVMTRQAGTLTEALRINSSGNLGLGTTSPLGKLHMQGTTSGLPANSGTTPANLGIRLGNTSGNGVLDIGVLNGTGPWLQATRANDLSNYDSIMLNPRGGKVGIGSTSPAAILDVADASTTTSAIIVPRAGAFTGTTVNGMVRYNSTSNLFEFYQNGAWVNYTTVSDARLKTNVVPLTSTQGLDIVNQLNPVFYDWDKSNPRTESFGDKHQLGFIAQEVEEVLPEVVDVGEDSYRSVQYGKIVSVVVAAVKELYSKILGIEEQLSVQSRQIASKADKSEVEAKLEAKDREIKKLQQENADMKARLDEIEKMLKSK